MRLLARWIAWSGRVRCGRSAGDQPFRGCIKNLLEIGFVARHQDGGEKTNVPCYRQSSEDNREPRVEAPSFFGSAQFARLQLLIEVKWIQPGWKAAMITRNGVADLRHAEFENALATVTMTHHSTYL